MEFLNVGGVKNSRIVEFKTSVSLEILIEIFEENEVRLVDIEIEQIVNNVQLSGY